MSKENEGAPGSTDVVWNRKEERKGAGREEERERTEEQETHVGELFISWQGPGGQ